jgi:hypothetical protein
METANYIVGNNNLSLEALVQNTMSTVTLSGPGSDVTVHVTGPFALMIRPEEERLISLVEYY